MSKQTAVEWLIEQVNHKGVVYNNYNIITDIPKEIIEQANEMQRKQRFQDFKEGFQAAFDSLQAANNLVQNKKYGGDK